MKSKSSGFYLGLIVLILVLVVWKLNEFYKTEKSSLIVNQIHQQNLNLKTSVSAQLLQLRNTISSYQGQLNESQINWVQLNPFFALAQIDINNAKTYKIKNLFVKSGTIAENWTIEFVLKALSYGRYSGQPLHIQLFQNQNSQKFMAVIFLDEKNLSAKQATLLIGDASYFQNFFDIQRSGQSTNVLLTKDRVVAGHTQSDYIATQTKELELSSKKYFLDKDEIRSTNLILLSYSLQNINKKWLAIPLFITLFIFGLAFLAMGLVLYYFKPQLQSEKKAEIFKKVFEEVKQKNTPIQTASPEVKTAEYNLTNDDKSLLDFDLSTIPAASEPFSEKSLHWLTTESAASEINTETSQNTPEPLPESVNNLIPLEDSIPQLIKVELQKIILEVIKEYEGRIEINFQCLSLKKYELDIKRFKKAIINFIENAIEARSTQLKITILDLKYGACIEMTDNGSGFSEGVEEKIWQPYFTTKDKLKHKGLGLPEALSIVRRYGGDIKIQSSVEPSMHGTCVKIFMNQQDAEEVQKSKVSHDDNYSSVPGTESVESVLEISNNEIDLDKILKLDDVVDENNLVKAELTPKHFKISTEALIDESKVIPVEKPQIEFSKTEKAFEEVAIKIRRPGKS